MGPLPPKNRKTITFVLLALALILRLGVLFIAYYHPERTLTNDSLSYIEPARYALRDGAYTYPGALRTPVYPLFIAMIYALFGENPFHVVWVQVLIGLATLYLTYKIASDLFPAQNNLTGILLLAFGLESILSPFYVMTETLFTFLLACLLLVFLVYRRSLNYIWLAAGGVLSGLAILCRPIALCFPGVIVFFLVWEHRRKVMQWLKAGVIYLTVTFLCVIPWVARNYRETGLPVVSTITGDSLLFYNASALVAHQKQVGFFEVQKEMYPALEQALADANLPDTEYNRYNMEVSMARQIIFKAPITYLFIHVRDSLKVFLPGTASLREVLGYTTQGVDLWDLLQTQGMFPALREYFRQTQGMQLLLIPFVALLFVTCASGLFGVFVLFRNKSWFELMVLFLPVAYLIFFSGIGSYSRFRIPLMPFLSVLAGVGLIFIKDNPSRKNG